MTQTDDDFLASRGLTEFEDRLAGWETNDDDTPDTVHAHFTKLEPTFSDWIDVADEGRRLFSLMFDERVEDYSAMQAILSGIAAAGYCLAIQQVAKRMGVSSYAVRVALENEEITYAASFANECIAKDKETPNERKA